jgi:long-subunit fatty acid transport protein
VQAFRYQRIIVFIIVVFCSINALSVSFVQAKSPGRIEIPSSFNPVGSGARAIAMGGAFIALADDATAMSWNPAGLVQLERPEMSIVLSKTYRTEDNTFGTHPEAKNNRQISFSDINFLSLAYPFRLPKFRAAAVGASYQRLYDMHRNWNFNLVEEDDDFFMDQKVDYRQNGSLSALGFALSTEITGHIMAGLTFNMWNTELNPSGWTQDYSQFGAGSQGASRFIFRAESKNEFDFKGSNFNIGVLWQIKQTPTYGLTIGAVYKTSFKAELTRKSRYKTSIRYPNDPNADQFNSDSSKKNQIMDMPASYGIGLAWRYNNDLIWTLDIYRTEWNKFILTDEDGNNASPISGRPMNESDIDPTVQCRTGIQYIFRWWQYGPHEVILPIRGGVFFDPAPAKARPDDFFGFSLGFGASIKKKSLLRFSLDVAYQYRFGEDVGGSILEHFDFSQDVSEHAFYGSCICYF